MEGEKPHGLLAAPQGLLSQPKPQSAFQKRDVISLLCCFEFHSNFILLTQNLSAMHQISEYQRPSLYSKALY